MPKKAFALYPRTRRAQTEGLETSFGRIRWSGKTVLNTFNKDLADEIEQKYGKHGTGDAYAVHDEQLSRAKNGEVWDVKTEKGKTTVKTLHNYTFTNSKIRPLTTYEKMRKFLIGKNLAWIFWFWNTINPNYKREIGFRLLGMEFKWER